MMAGESAAGPKSHRVMTRYLVTVKAMKYEYIVLILIKQFRDPLCHTDGLE